MPVPTRARQSLRHARLELVWLPCLTVRQLAVCMRLEGDAEMAGGVWRNQFLFEMPFTQITFINACSGLVVGGGGRIGMTSDGGSHWTLRSSEPDVTLRDVAAIGFNHAWAVGDHGTIVATVDGDIFTRRDSEHVPNKQLSGVSFVDVDRGWVVGEDGTILVTTNGGDTFTHQNNPDPSLQDLLDVVFVNANTGFAVGAGGTILKTTSGGDDWMVHSSETTAQLFGVHFVDEMTGWVVGREGTILNTTNGGNTWIGQSLPAGSPESPKPILLGVDFVDAMTGWVVGTEDTILNTTNGGNTWVSQPHPEPGPAFTNFTGVVFPDACNGYVVASNTILKYSYSL